MHFIYKILAFTILSESIKCMPQSGPDVMGALQPRRIATLRRPIKGFNHTQTSNVANISSVTRDENGKLQVMNPNVAPTITIRKAESIATPQQIEDNYPYDRLSQLDLSPFASFFDKEEILPAQDDEEASRNAPSENSFTNRVALRINTMASQMEERLCAFTELKKQPRTGNNKEGISVTIINHANASQTFSYELCGESRVSDTVDAQKPNEVKQVCNYHDSFPNNIKRTECRQQYAYRKLLAYDNNEKVVVDDFIFPSHCECFLIKN